jgi:hypothetical protein
VSLPCSFSGGASWRSGGATLLLLTLLAPARLAAQSDAASLPPNGTFENEDTRRLHAVAREAWLRVERDVLSYTALVKQRAAVELRLPLKDRTLFRGESASRVFWSRDGAVLVQALGSRVWHPGNVDVEEEDFWQSDVYDPTGSGDRLSFGMMGNRRGDVWFEHPLGRNAAQHYRFRTGDTLTLTFPDGRRFRSVELEVIPREAQIRRITGSLWIDPETGSLVRAAYRLSKQVDVEADMPEEVDEDLRYVPGLFKPFTFDVTLITVEYSLWDFRVWLPRSLRAEGVLGAGIIKVPAAAELSYEMESVVIASNGATPAAAAQQGPPMQERHFRTRSEALAYLAELAGQAGVAYERDDDVDRDDGRSVRYLVPQDRTQLAASPELPPPIWEDGPGFLTGAQLDELTGMLDDLPVPVPGQSLWSFNWGPQRPDLLRYNRIEGPSVGARFQVLLPTPAGPVSASVTPFFGVADLSLKARFSVERETLSRKLALGLYRELEPVSRNGRHLGIGNSLNAVMFGRDDGDYFMATGADLRATPPSAERRSWDVRLYAEQHRAVEPSTSFSLFHAFDGDWAFRPNVMADELSEVGAAALITPWWGTDPLSFQSGAELYAQGATGTFRYARASLTLRAAAPLFGGRVRVGAEAGAGESWGEPPTQRAWFLGGPQSLRGYSAASLVGPSFARARLEVARVFSGTSIALFGDGGWAGTRLDAFEEQDALYSVGAGFSLLDGVIRLDVAKGLRGRRSLRWDLYLDGIL